MGICLGIAGSFSPFGHAFDRFRGELSAIAAYTRLVYHCFHPRPDAALDSNCALDETFQTP